MFYDFITKNTDIFIEKMSAKVSHIFSTKNIGTFKIFTFEILMSCLLTTSLVLNNRALEASKDLLS